MIYICNSFHFALERVGSADTCPDCGKPIVREATDDEKDECHNNRALREDGEKHIR